MELDGYRNIFGKPDKADVDAINFFNDINREFGDTNVAGQRHPFRLAGYANNKPGREAFFVKIVSANSRAENRIAEYIAENPELSLTRGEIKRDQNF